MDDLFASLSSEPTVAVHDEGDMLRDWAEREDGEEKPGEEGEDVGYDG